jgi:L-alanine-DL-glutamate epimerase-like enolase superfamily enzyme
MKKHSDLNDKENSRDSGNRRDFLKKASIGGLGVGLLGTNNSAEIFAEQGKVQSTSIAVSKIKITDVKCAIISNSAVVRVTTDQGISGYAQGETSKPYLKPFVLFYKDYLIGEDPTNVERTMMKIRRMGGFKPWGTAVSIIEMALWDIAGKVANLPVYKLLGGKIRDQVRVYNTAVHRFPVHGTEPSAYADSVARNKASAEGFTIIKHAIGFHSAMATQTPNFFYGTPAVSNSPKSIPHANRGPLTEKGLKSMIAVVEAMKKVLGDEVGLALDCGPGYMVPDAIRLAKALEPYNLMWLEDLITGDYYPYVMADLYREVTQATTTPTHTGEQIFLRQNYRELIEQKAIRIIGPDPADVGGISELKWIAQYADLHGIQIAPHGIFNGVFGLAAHVQVGSTMPENFIAFEYPAGDPEWWYDIVEGLPDPIVKNGLVTVWDRPGIGVDFNVMAAKKYLSEEDKKFFD